MKTVPQHICFANSKPLSFLLTQEIDSVLLGYFLPSSFVLQSNVEGQVTRWKFDSALEAQTTLWDGTYGCHNQRLVNVPHLKGEPLLLLLLLLFGISCGECGTGNCDHLFLAFLSLLPFLPVANFLRVFGVDIHSNFC